ncbi:MAG: DUF2341 domain-containing protein [Candidatus Nanohaloarchaea archaeon]|nr:DUF2341 domain-containing protein [Candidatus Nanohaloarchaea archaeon]
MTRRKAQFFIITAVLVAGSLSITVNVLDDYTQINYDEITTSSSIAEYESLERNIDELWYEETWQYRQQVTVFERAGRDIENYPVSIQLDTQSLIGAGKMQSDCGDLRIVEDGREIPYQIEDGECGENTTTVWFLTSVPTNSRDEDVFVYYGNPNSQAPNYDTGLQVNADDEAVTNGVITLRAGTTPSGAYGLVEARRLDTPNFVRGTLIYKGDPATADFQVVEQGPIYVTFRFNATHNYTVFTQNNFIRRNGNITLGPDTTFYYGTDNTLLTHWQAGSEANQHEIGSTDTWTGTFGQNQFPYIGALNTTSETGLMLTTKTTGLSHPLSVYTATGGWQAGVEDRVGFGPATSTVEAPYLDWSLHSNGLNTFTADIHSNPPLAVVTGDEEAGTFTPSAGWTNKATITVEERNGTSLTMYPVNATFNLGEMDVREDCQDLIFVERGQRVPHLLRDQCDSLTFSGPDGFTARWPFDEGYGNWANGTTNTFSGQLQGSPQPSWIPGRFGFALRFDGQNRVFVDDIPRIELRNSDFTISLWFRGSMADQDFGQTVGLVSYPQDTPELRIVQNGGNPLLQARFRNETDDLFTLNGATDLQGLAPGWHHVAYTYDEQSGNISLYLDGRFERSMTVDGPMLFTSDEITIGEGFDGSIDELKIYKSELSADSVLDQADTRTTVTFLTNITALATESDVAAFAGNTAGLDETYTLADIQPDARIAQPADRPVTLSVTEPRSYREAIKRFESVILDAELSTDISLTVQNQCTVVSFESEHFDLEDRVC